ncbi:hypothetical protein GH714_040882 [Hevea brasiliensis]|uniref:Uncharacterized protein n=1 Tax=Hevea brasiliensis TaxID=3981 RepID=A0A6A6MGK6_HEVBR|nr:hypothetical protein GH714_040882 [Hevea brasiliensis]
MNAMPTGLRGFFDSLFQDCEVCNFIWSTMTEEKIYVIREHDPTPMIPASDSLLVIQESDSISLVPETYSASVVPESDTPVVLEGTEPKDGHVQRYSAGNIGIPYKSVKILSRYLAASTGSCHDYCKYGQRQDLETKTTSNSILETIMERQGEGQDMGKVLTLGERKKKLAVNYVSSRGSGSRILIFLLSAERSFFVK